MEDGCVGLHFSQLNQCYWWADHRNCHFAEQRLNHADLSAQCLLIAEFEHDAFEPSIGFV